MREITSHKVNGCNEAIQVDVLDLPGSGGANHHYRIKGYGTPPGYEGAGVATGTVLTEIHFQNGPLKDAGVNGVTNEALLAIVIDRLQCFQKGQYSCRENAIALTKLEECMFWLQHRTRERVARGVEGTHEK